MWGHLVQSTNYCIWLFKVGGPDAWIGGRLVGSNPPRCWREIFHLWCQGNILPAEILKAVAPERQP